MSLGCNLVCFCGFKATKSTLCASAREANGHREQVTLKRRRHSPGFPGLSNQCKFRRLYITHQTALPNGRTQAGGVSPFRAFSTTCRRIKAPADQLTSKQLCTSLKWQPWQITRRGPILTCGRAPMSTETNLYLVSVRPSLCHGGRGPLGKRFSALISLSLPSACLRTPCLNETVTL